MGIFYTTRESVKAALDVAETAQADSQVDDAIDAASREIEQRCNRIFYPQVGTRYFDWPSDQNGTAYRLWLEENEVAEVSALHSGSVLIDPAAYSLEPYNDGPPYDHIELKLAGSGSFGQSSSHQRDIAVAGVFAGAPVTEKSSGVLGAAIALTTSTMLTCTEPWLIGVGSLLRVDDERMVVTDRSWADSGDAAGALSGLDSARSVTVSDGTGFRHGETILVDAEQMRVDAIAGNTLVVKRAVNGSVLADHAADTTIYRSTLLTVERGVLGTTAAAHSLAAPVVRWEAPTLVGSLTRAQAIDTLLQERSGYARTVGSGDNARNASGVALDSLWARVEDAYRRVRLGVV